MSNLSDILGIEKILQVRGLHVAAHENPWQLWFLKFETHNRLIAREFIQRLAQAPSIQIDAAALPGEQLCQAFLGQRMTLMQFPSGFIEFNLPKALVYRSGLPRVRGFGVEDFCARVIYSRRQGRFSKAKY